jgi:hypothetical protein
MSHHWKPGSFRKVKPSETGYKSKTAPQYLILRGKRAGEVVSNAERFRLRFGLHPSKVSAEHKAGKRHYASAASEAQAKAQIATRKKHHHAVIERRNKKPFRLFDKRLNRWRGFRNETAVHVFLNKEGATDSREFKGRNLAIAQNYRADWYGSENVQTLAGGHGGAVFTGDGSALEKYDHIAVYDVDGDQVHFETDVEKLRAWWLGMSRRQRNEFEKELFYLKERPRLDNAA